MKKVAILQSNYIPWKGYFDIIGLVDEFILYDDMQYTRRDWRNRNKIKTPGGLKWLTIPVETKGKFFQPIKDTQVSDPAWAASHLRTLEVNYAKAPYYHACMQELFPIFRQAAKETYLSRINYLFLTKICKMLGISTKISWSSDYPLAEGKTERLVSLVGSAGGDAYLSGPAAKDYIIPDLFAQAGIALEWMDYSGYPEYPQLYDPFEHGVSILDLLFCMGPDAAAYMKFSSTL